MQIKRWLVIRADGEVKVRTKSPSGKLALDEVGIPLVLDFADGWGGVVDDQIDVHMPSPPTVEPDEPIFAEGEDDED